MQGRKETATIEKKQEQDRCREEEGCQLLLVQEDQWGQKKKEDIFKEKFNAVKKKVNQNYLDKKVNEDSEKNKKNINAVKKMVANNY